MSQPTIREPGAPATDRQLDYIRALKDGRVIDDKWRARIERDLAAGLTKLAASKIIDWLLKQERQAVSVSLAPSAVPATTAPVAIPGVGHYEHNGTLYAVVDRKRGRRTIRSLRQLFLNPDGSWSWRAASVAWRTLVPVWQPLTLDQAAAFGHATGTCLVCARTLTDPESVARGIGPVCAARFGRV